MLADIARLTGRRAPRCEFRAPRIFPVAYAAELWARFTGAPAVHHAGRDPHGAASHVLHRGQGRRELGFKARPYRGGARGRDPLVRGGRIFGQEAPKRRRKNRAGLAPNVGIAAHGIAGLPDGGDAIGIAQRGEFVGVAIARRRAREGILQSPGACRFRRRRAAAAQKRGDPLLRHRARPGQPEHGVGGDEACPARLRRAACAPTARHDATASPACCRDRSVGDRRPARAARAAPACRRRRRSR